jgi:hypothetical protein
MNWDKQWKQIESLGHKVWESFLIEPNNLRTFQFWSFVDYKIVCPLLKKKVGKCYSKNS